MTPLLGFLQPIYSAFPSAIVLALRKVIYQPNKGIITGPRPAVVSLENFTTARMEEGLC